MGQDKVAAQAIQFYQNQFTSETDNGELTLLNDINSCITIDDNQMLDSMPSEEEIKRVVFELIGDTASGPDGFTCVFYQVKNF